MVKKQVHMLQALPIGNQKPGIVAMALPSAGPVIRGKLFNLRDNEDNEACSSYCTMSVNVHGDVNSFVEM